MLSDKVYRPYRYTEQLSSVSTNIPLIWAQYLGNDAAHFSCLLTNDAGVVWAAKV